MPRFQNLRADVARLYSEHYWAAAVCWLPWAALVAMQPAVSALPVAIIAAGIVILGQAALSAYGLHLQHLMGSQDDIFLSVRLNEIDLGVIPAHEYAAMRYRAAFSLVTYLRQLLNLVAAAKNIATWLATFVPVVLFWSIVAVLFLDPLALPSAADVVRDMAEVPTSAAFAKSALPGLAMLVVPMLILYTAWRPRFLGLRSEHRAAWEHELRNRLNLPTTGELSLYRIRGNDADRINDLTAFLAFWRQRYAVGRHTAGTPEGAPR